MARRARRRFTPAFAVDDAVTATSADGSASNAGRFGRLPGRVVHRLSRRR
jgi:hypothetical protein